MINAVQAMSESGGELILSVSRAPETKRCIDVVRHRDRHRGGEY